MKSTFRARAPRAMRARLLTTATAAIVIGGCASGPSDQKAVYAQAAGAKDDPSSTAYLVATADDLTVVDCLLPGKLRKMGQTVTWVTRPRPVKKTASDCEILGGQYVLFDRANYDTALAVWMLSAKEGDPVAQTYVGEIYERGLGRAPNYAEAATWYRKAAQQGNARAQFRFGILCEKGLGVPQDKVKALKWYRESAGLPESSVANISRAVAKSTPKSRSPSRKPSVASKQQAAPSNAAPKKVSNEQAAAEIAKIEAKARASESQLNRTESAAAEKKNQIRIQSRKSRVMDQTASAAKPQQRRLIDQYVALSQEAENQRIAHDGLKKVLEVGEPVVIAQR